MIIYAGGLFRAMLTIKDPPAYKIGNLPLVRYTIILMFIKHFCKKKRQVHPLHQSTDPYDEGL